jgi:translation initiation factor 2D
LQNHSTFSTISEEETKDAKRAARQVASQNGDVLAKAGGKGKGKGKEILIEELWKPSGGAVSFWEAAGVE